MRHRRLHSPLAYPWSSLALVPLLRRLRFPDRAAYTLAGVTLVVWWLLLRFVLAPVLPEFSGDISIFVVSGVMTVIGVVLGP